MDKNLVFKKYIPCGMLLLMGLIAFFAMLFPVLELNYYEKIYYGYESYAYELVPKSVSENGFKMLAFKSEFISKGLSGANAPLGIIALFTLLVSIATIAVSIFGFVSQNEKLSKKLVLIFVVICLLQLFLYMLSGIIFKALYNSIGVWYNGSSVSDERIISIKTLAFIPFIFGVIVAVVYFILPLFTKTNAVSENNAALTSSNAQKKLSELKQLWDLGVITEDEYREKSKKYIENL